VPEARFFLRHYCVNGFELVCYAIPPGREVDLSGEDDEAAVP
jgi:hypothetical protein